MGKALDNSFLIQAIARYSPRAKQIIPVLNKSIQSKCSGCRTRTKKAGKETTFKTADIRVKVADALGSLCPYCGEKITHKNFSLDHILPLARGGESDLDNIEIICLTCNKQKDKMLKDEFVKLKNLIKELTPESQRYVNSQLSMAVVFKNFKKAV